MQLVRGKTLRALIPGNGLPLGQVFDIGIPLTGAVAAAHQANLTHRDLKPDNVMVTDDGRVKVLDFGLARLVESSDPGAESEVLTVSRLTEVGVVMGTVGYMAPEQVRGQPVGPGADVFALGVIAHEPAVFHAPGARSRRATRTGTETSAACTRCGPTARNRPGRTCPRPPRWRFPLPASWLSP